MSAEITLSIRDMRVSFPTDSGDVQAVRGIDLDVADGELVGIVGESGSGKSVTFLAVMGLLPKSAKITGSAKSATAAGLDTRSIASCCSNRCRSSLRSPAW